MNDWWGWLTLAGLGAYHGINPAMGWLFAVALGMQEKRRRAVLAAIPPIALGHALSIGGVVALLWFAQSRLPLQALRYFAAAILIGFALFRLIRSRHPKWVGMRVGFGDLTLWSFIMATAHGAGLMLGPVMLSWFGVGGGVPVAQSADLSAAAHLAHMPVQHVGETAGPWRWFAAVGVHSVSYLVVAGLVATLVYEKLGLALLRRVWFNLDWLWTAVLTISGIVILLN